tara:strand:- start:2298 stop:2564 length:267 start_codon:yes stop_codon:yes gene_type:complete
MYKTYLTKSKQPSVRIKRAVKQLKDTNEIIGNTLFEQIIAVGVAETENQLEYLKSQNKRSIIKPQIYEDVISILKDNLEQINESTYTE